MAWHLGGRLGRWLSGWVCVRRLTSLAVPLAVVLLAATAAGGLAANKRDEEFEPQWPLPAAAAWEAMPEQPPKPLFECPPDPPEGNPPSSLAYCTGTGAFHTCAFCNLYFNTVKEEFLFYTGEPSGRGGQRPTFRFNTTWTPNLMGYYFGPAFRVQPVPTALLGVHPEPTVVFPHMIDNYCHQMNDIVVPLFWLLARVQAPGQPRRVWPEAARLFCLHKFNTSTDFGFAPLVRALKPLFSTRDILFRGSWENSTSTSPSASGRSGAQGSVHVLFRRVVGGAHAISAHHNQGYTNHPWRNTEHPQLTPRTLARTYMRFRDYVHRRLLPDGPGMDYSRPLWDPARSADMAPGSVVFFNRRKHRRILNADRTLDGLARFLAAQPGPPAQLHPRIMFFEDFASLDDLVLFMSKVRLLISPHGAGLTNMLYMRPGAAVIELIPYLCQRLEPMYRTMAEALGLQYYMWQPSTSEAVPGLSADQLKHFDDLRLAEDEACTDGAGDRPFHVDVPSLAATVGMALDRERAFRQASLARVEAEVSHPEQQPRFTLDTRFTAPARAGASKNKNINDINSSKN